MRLLPRRGFGPVLEVVATLFMLALMIPLVIQSPPRLGTLSFWLLLLASAYGAWALIRIVIGVVADWRRLNAPRRPGQTALQTVTDGEEG